MKQDLYRELLTLLLPQELFNYFELVQLTPDSKRLDIYLDEKHLYPDGYDKSELNSQGFYPSTCIQDFPLREKATYLHIRRRKWLVKSTGEIISRNWELTAKGTKLTEDFAAFLKGVLGYLSDK